jgi:predicted ArsR family transcriptional regulator
MTARPQLNEAGDLVVTDAAALRLLAVPGSLELFDHLSRRDPAGADELAGELGTTMSREDVADRLERMAAAGLVVADGNLWSAAGRGVLPYTGRAADDAPEGARRVRVLSYFLPTAEQS